MNIETLKHITAFLLGLLIGLSLLLLAITARGQSMITLAVLPEQVERGESFFITVSTSAPNQSFRIEITDRFGGTTILKNRTDAIGLWQTEVSALMNLGTYRLTAYAVNETDYIMGSAQQELVVVCRGQCVALAMAEQFAYQSAVLADYVFRVSLVLFLSYATIELPRLTAWLYRENKRAKVEGRSTVAETLLGPFLGVRTFIAPSRQGTLMRSNERIAIDQRRREIMDQLHRATSDRYREYNPEHTARLREILGTLDQATVMQRQLSAQPPTIHHEFTEQAVAPTMAEIDALGDTVVPKRVVARLHRRYVAAGAAFWTIGMGSLAILVLEAMYFLFDFRVPDWLWLAWFESIPTWTKLLSVFVFAATLGVLVRSHKRYRFPRGR